jgi:transposase
MSKVSAQVEAEILRLHFAEQWKVGTIAAQLGVHHCAVRRVLRQAGLPMPKLSPRPSVVDPYLSFIHEVLDKYPKLPASRLFHMVKQRGYPGSESRLREVVALVRPKPKGEAYLRLSTLPGEQAQVDWAHFGKLRVGRALRRLLAFVMVLSWSRKIFLRFFLDARMPSFLRGHVEAFSAFGGVARNLLYDNLKSAVVERVDDAIRFHPTLLELATHYRFGPRAAAPGRGNEKGRVERAIRYVRDSFFAGREVTDLDELNEQARIWCLEIADARRWPDDRDRTVGEAFEQERGYLLALPDDDFPCTERVEVAVRKRPYVRFDKNDYSVPHELVHEQLVVLADLERIRVCKDTEVVATHERCWDARQVIEDSAHIEALVEHKRAARRHRGMDRLRQAAPHSENFLRAVAERGLNLGSTTARLLALLDEYGAGELDEALRETTGHGLVRVHSVRQILEQRRHAEGRPPPIAVALPYPRLRDVVVRPHDLSTYDQINKNEDDDDDEASD